MCDALWAWFQENGWRPQLHRCFTGLYWAFVVTGTFDSNRCCYTDINECQESHPCNQHCLNTVGSYRCACEPGFHLRNRRCIGKTAASTSSVLTSLVPSHSFVFTSDINECRQRVCRLDQQCKNTRGGYTCIDLCPSGLTKAANGTCIGEHTQLFDKW